MIIYELTVQVQDDEVPERLKREEIIAVVERGDCPAGVHVVVKNIKVEEILDVSPTRAKGE